MHPSRPKSLRERPRHLLLLSQSPRKWQNLHPKKLATRATTRATTQKAKEEAAKKKKSTKKTEEEPRKRRKYVAQPDTDEEEKTESEDINQFKVVSHPKSSIDKLCKKIRNDDLNDLKNVDFNKLTKEEKNKVEEYIYAMMVDYKHTPLELDGKFPKDLYKIIEDKWHFCLQMEKEIRESTLASLLPDLTKSQIVNAVKRHNNRFTPKYRAFSILQNKIEEVV